MKKIVFSGICAVLIAVAFVLITRAYWQGETTSATQPEIQSRQAPDRVTSPGEPTSASGTPEQPQAASPATATYDFIAQWQQQIRTSDRPQDQLLAALINKADANEQETFLLRAWESIPDNILLNYAIADHCGRNSHASLCALVDAERLLVLDGDNGYMWTTLANQAYGNGDTDGALRYLQQAVGLYQYNSQTPQLLQLIDESLTHHGAPRDFELVTATMGLQAAQVLPSQLSGLTRMCREQSHWQQTCQGLGQTMMSQGREAMDVAVGQQLVSHYSAREEQVPLPAEWNAFIDSTESQEQARLVDILLAENPPVSDAIWNEYLQRFQEQGAPAAYYFLIETLLAQEN